VNLEKAVEYVATLVQAVREAGNSAGKHLNTSLNALVVAQQQTDRKPARLIEGLLHQRTNGRR